MTKPRAKRLSFDGPGAYEIRVQGRIPASWSDRLEGMSITLAEPDGEPPETILAGELLDQAALTGVLNTLYDLRLPMLSVKRIDDEG